MENQDVPVENKMGTMPVPKLILTISLPMVFSMFVQALYNIVDSIFVARVNEAALTAVSLAFPIQVLMLSVGIGTAVGVNALLSRRLGQKRQDEVNKAAMNGLFLSACSFAGFALLGMLILEPYLTTQVDDGQIIGYATEYLTVVVFGSFGFFMLVMFDRILQATGLTVYTMVSQLAGAVTNIVFDPLLIFGIGSFPEMGVAGAAAATILGQYVSLGISFFFNITKNKEVRFHLKGFRPDGRIIAEIYKVGVPSILLSAIGSVTTYLMDIVLGSFSTTAIAVYGVYFKINSFIFMPLFGLNNGLIPILAYNYGAEKKARIKRAIKAGTLYGVVLMAAGTVIFELFPVQLLQLFKASDKMLAIGVPALRIIATSFVGAAIVITLTSVFQAFSKAVYSMIVSFMRQLVVLFPSAYVLSLSGEIGNVWWCFPIAEVMSLSVSAFYMARIYRKKIMPLPEEEPA